MLALPEGKVEYDLFIHLSHGGRGVVLMQQGKVITYPLRQLKDFETKYLTYDLELVVVIFSIKI